jgi:ribosomal protein S18 acetylase RimI-like enzyme
VNLTLRPCEPGDFETLYRIDRACYEPGIAYSRAALREYLAWRGSHCLIALVDDEIAGFLIAYWQRWLGHIITIDVLEAARRHGVASAMLGAVEREMAQDGVRIIELETAVNNAPAIAFWKKHGYRTLGVYPRYYANRIDAFHMVKQLEPVATARAGRNR